MNTKWHEYDVYRPIPEDIKNMTHEERQREIARLEAEARKKREAKEQKERTVVMA